MATHLSRWDMLFNGSIDSLSIPETFYPTMLLLTEFDYYAFALHRH